MYWVCMYCGVMYCTIIPGQNLSGVMIPRIGQDVNPKNAEGGNREREYLLACFQNSMSQRETATKNGSPADDEDDVHEEFELVQADPSTECTELERLGEALEGDSGKVVCLHSLESTRSLVPSKKTDTIMTRAPATLS